MNNPAPRSKSAMLFMAAPIILGGFLFLAVAILAFLVWIGTEANGKRVKITIHGQCIAEANSIIQNRMSEIGLSQIESTKTKGVLEIKTTLPQIENAEKELPELLIQQGVLSVRSQEEWISEKLSLQSVGIAQDESGMPYTRVVLEDSLRKNLEKEVAKNPQGHLYFYLDGKEIVKRPNHNLIRSDELRLRSIVGGKRDQMKKTVDWSIVLRHGPIPCSLSLKEVLSL